MRFQFQNGINFLLDTQDSELSALAKDLIFVDKPAGVRTAKLIQYYEQQLGQKLFSLNKLSKNTTGALALSFKKQSFSNDELSGIGFNKIANLLPFYFENSRGICLSKNDEQNIQKSKAFEQQCPVVLQNLSSFLILQIKKKK